MISNYKHQFQTRFDTFLQNLSVSWFHKISPNQMTFFGLCSAIITFILIIFTQFQLAILFLFLNISSDVLDGALARNSGGLTQRGYFIDTVIDRVSDVMIFGALLLAGYSTLPLIIIIVCSILIPFFRTQLLFLGVRPKRYLFQKMDTNIYILGLLGVYAVLENIKILNTGLAILAVLLGFSTLHLVLSNIRKINLQPIPPPDDPVTSTYEEDINYYIISYAT